MANDNSNEASIKIDFLEKARQVRQFTDTPVPQQAIDDILEVARWSGSGNNGQPWELVLVRNHDTLQQIATQEARNSWLGGAEFALVIVLPGDDKTVIYAHDEGRLSERLILAAEAYGVGAGIWWFKDGGDAAKNLLGIPADRLVRSAIGFGYAAQNPLQSSGRGGRKPVAELVHQEKF